MTHEVEAMTRLGDSLCDFRSIPYPASKEREAEIERIHRNEQAAQSAEYRACLIGFATECIEGKKGRSSEELANGIIAGAQYVDLIDPRGNAEPANLVNLILWDIRRQVAWSNAKARGELVPERLKSRDECLAIWKAKKFADEKWDYNAPVKKAQHSEPEDDRDEFGF